MADPKSKIPRLVRGADLRSLPLSPIEGFVLSRVDGSASVADIADLTSQPLEMVLATVQKLITLDALEWADGATGLPRPSVRPPSLVSSAPPGSTSAPPAVFPSLPGPPPVPSLDAPPKKASPDAQRLPNAASSSAPPGSHASTRASVLPPKRERPQGVHVYGQKGDSGPPIIDTFEQRKAVPLRSPVPRAHETVGSRPPGASSRPPVPQSRPPGVSSTPPGATAGTTGARTPSGSPLTQPAVGKQTSSGTTSAPVASQPPAAPSARGSGAPKGGQPSGEPAQGAENELAPERRKKIDDLYIVVELLDHYQVLGLERSAERAAVKAAYFELSKEFHPDTAFRKNIGAYRTKMEVIFKRLTEAYDVLSKKKPREEYDAYLARSEKSQEYEQTLSSQHDLESALAAIEAEAQREDERARAREEEERSARLQQERLVEQQRERERHRQEEQQRLKADGMGTANTPAVFSPRTARPSTQGLSAVSSAGAVGAPTPSSAGNVTAATASSAGSVGAPQAPRTPAPPAVSLPPGPVGQSDRAPISDEAKRRARELFTRRLDATRPPTKAHDAPPTPAPQPTDKRAVIRDLAVSIKGAAHVTGGLDPLQRHLAEARRALSDQQLPEAVRALRLAVALAPDDRTIKAEHDRVAHQLAASLADNYKQQAEYEERHQKWAAAAVSWQRVVDGRPEDARAHWRCARALLEASGDTRQAVRLAQRAVDLTPQDIFAIRMLGRAFTVAGMTLNARRELEKALALDPKDETTKGMLKALKGA